MIAQPTPFLRAIAAVRVDAWGVTTDGPKWLDEWDLEAQHHVVIRDGEVVAACRFTIHETLDLLPHRAIYGDLLDDLPVPIAWASRLVVAHAWRGRGLSHALDTILASEPFNQGACSIVATGGSVEANLHRHRIMLKHGWVHLGEAAAVTAAHLPSVITRPPSVYARIGAPA